MKSSREIEKWLTD